MEKSLGVMLTVDCEQSHSSAGVLPRYVNPTMPTHEPLPTAPDAGFPIHHP
jgi:hypothetical protein